MMEMPPLYQLVYAGTQTQAEFLAVFLENIWPEPLSVSLEHNDTSPLWHVNVHYDHKPDTNAILSQIEQVRDTQEDWPLSVSEIENIDWVSKVQSQLHPIQAGRFFIYGAHDKEKAVGKSFAIQINANQAFGTAHHETTQACLTLLDELGNERTPKTILDLGTGTAILSIAARQLWKEAHILATDIEPVSIGVAKDNCAINNVTVGKDFVLKTADGFDHSIFQKWSQFDLIIANILAKPLISLSSALTNRLSPNGKLILSGLLTSQEPDILAAYEPLGLTQTKALRLGDWSALLLARP